VEGEGVKSPEGRAGAARSARDPPTTHNDAGGAGKREAPLGRGSSQTKYFYQVY